MTTKQDTPSAYVADLAQRIAEKLTNYVYQPLHESRAAEIIRAEIQAYRTEMEAEHCVDPATWTVTRPEPKEPEVVALDDPTVPYSLVPVGEGSDGLRAAVKDALLAVCADGGEERFISEGYEAHDAIIEEVVKRVRAAAAPAFETYVDAVTAKRKHDADLDAATREYAAVSCFDPDRQLSCARIAYEIECHLNAMQSQVRARVIPTEVLTRWIRDLRAGAVPASPDQENLSEQVYWKRAVAFVADELEKLSAAQLDERRLKMLAVLRNAAHEHAPYGVPASPWQPISSAPSDGKAILVWEPERKNIYCVARFPGGEWTAFGGGREATFSRVFTHWMPLPDPPAPHRSETHDDHEDPRVSR